MKIIFSKKYCARWKGLLVFAAGTYYFPEMKFGTDDKIILNRSTGYMVLDYFVLVFTVRLFFIRMCAICEIFLFTVKLLYYKCEILQGSFCLVFCMVGKNLYICIDPAVGIFLLI